MTVNQESSPELLTHLVVRELQRAIFEGTLKPGARIGQQWVAEQFGTSRVPVREALQVLQAEGLVTIRPHSGARVARLELEELSEIYEIREHLEPFALARSTPKLTENQLKSLEELASSIERAAADQDIGRWVELDRRFHITSMSAAPARLVGMIEALWNGTEHYRRTYLVIPGGLQIAQLEHRLLLETIKSGRGDDAANILTVHIRRTRETLSEHAELFERERPG
jgi:DNA-binding GntR family transcriptional regulator